MDKLISNDSPTRVDSSHLSDTVQPINDMTTHMVIDPGGQPLSEMTTHMVIDPGGQPISDMITQMVIDSGGQPRRDMSSQIVTGPRVQSVSDMSSQMVIDPECHVTGGISAHLVPEFSRKLSFIEVGDDSDDGQRNKENKNKAQNQKYSESSKAGDKLMAGYAASTITGETNEVPAGEARQPFVCVCGDIFDKSVQLAAHKRWSCKLKEKTAQCDVCKNWFASDMGLKRHMKHAHGGVHSCDNCSLRFPNKIKLTRHWMEAHYHDKSKLLKCFECGDTNFDNKLELECHLVLHKFEKHQEKLAHNASMSHHSDIHFTPYHTPPFLRSMRPLHPFHHPYGFGPQWSHFPFRPTPPLFPFMPYLPFRPPFPVPPPRPFRFPTNMRSYFAGQEDDTSIRSSSVADTVDRSSSKPTNETSTNDAAGAGSSHNPHHNHEYVEPTEFPCFFHQPYDYKQHRLHRHRHHDHHHIKKKWKKYLKLMMKGKVPHLLSHGSSRSEELNIGNPAHAAHQESSSSNTGEQNDEINCEFQMACKFCEKVIEKNKVVRHQKKECPVLSAHQCNVCDRVFKKRHFLIRHMHEQKHYCSSGPSMSHTGQTSFSSLSSLQEKMNASLHLLNVSGDVADESRVSNQQVPFAESFSNHGIPQFVSNKEKYTSHTDRENNLTGRPVLENCQRLQCSTCRLVCHSLENLKEHLNEHINQVLAVQKVREWTSKSSEYFFMGHLDEEDELEGSESISTATTSYLDSEITSTASSALQDVSGNFSSLDSAWMKPHKKRGKHRHKGEINVCDFCGERFAFRKELHYHMENSHKDSTLECPVCQKKFSWKKRGKFYERHLNSHYGVKIFKHKCSACGKTFLENSKLRAHMSLHNSELLHKCAVCDKGYANKSSLVRHERTHTGIKPYQCDICQESFMEKRELLRHSTTHTGLAPFSCTLCSQGFTLKTSLMSHMKKRHSRREKTSHI